MLSQIKPYKFLKLKYYSNQNIEISRVSVFSLLSLIFVLNSCAFENDIDPTFLVDLNTDIKIELYQELSEASNFGDYIWKISLNDIEVCEESQLLTNYVEVDNQDKLYIEGMSNPPECLQGDYEIFTTHKFSFKENEKLVKVFLANIENNLLLQDRGNYINIEYSALEGIKVEKDELLPIDLNHLWGGVYSNTEQEQFLFYNLFQQISEEILYDSISDGNYGYFTKGETISVVHPQLLNRTDHGFAVKIRSDFDWQTSQVQDFIASFRMQHPEIDFFISDGSGKLF